MTASGRPTDEPGLKALLVPYPAEEFLLLDLAMTLIDRAVAAYQDFVRVTGWTGNTALMVEAEFFGRDKPMPEFQERHGEIRGLSVEEYINRLGQDLIPIAERCARVMREALAALETLRAAPSRAIERSKPISLRLRW